MPGVLFRNKYAIFLNELINEPFATVVKIDDTPLAVRMLPGTSFDVNHLGLYFQTISHEDTPLSEGSLSSETSQYESHGIHVISRMEFNKLLMNSTIIVNFFRCPQISNVSPCFQVHQDAVCYDDYMMVTQYTYGGEQPINISGEILLEGAGLDQPVIKSIDFFHPDCGDEEVAIVPSDFLNGYTLATTTSYFEAGGGLTIPFELNNNRTDSTHCIANNKMGNLTSMILVTPNNTRQITFDDPGGDRKLVEKFVYSKLTRSRLGTFYSRVPESGERTHP